MMPCPGSRSILSPVFQTEKEFTVEQNAFLRT